MKAGSFWVENPSVNGGISAHRPVMQTFDVFLYISLKKLLSNIIVLCIIYMPKLVNIVQLKTQVISRHNHHITMTPKWSCWFLKSPASRLFTQLLIQAKIKENIKAPHHWPLCGESTGAREFPAKMASNAEKVSIWWCQHEKMKQLRMANIEAHYVFYPMKYTHGFATIFSKTCHDLTLFFLYTVKSLI